MAIGIKVLVFISDNAYRNIFEPNLANPRSIMFSTSPTTAEAVQRLKNERFDVLIIDNMVHGNDGLVLFEASARTSFGLPLILVADRSGQGDTYEAIENGTELMAFSGSDSRACFDKICEVIVRAMGEGGKAKGKKYDQWLEQAHQGSELGLWNLNLADMSGEMGLGMAGILGMESTEELNSRGKWDEITHPDDLEALNRRMNDYLEGRTQRFESEHRMKHSSGRWIWVLVRGKVSARLKDGTPSKVTGTLLDISRLKQLEIDLRNAQDDIASLHHLAHIATFSKSIATGKETWSEELYEMMGYDPSQPLMPFSERTRSYRQEDMDRIYSLYVKSLHTCEPYSIEMEIIRPDGNRWIHAWVVPKKDDKGNMSSLGGTVIDITESKMAELGLAKANRKLSILTGITRHDIYNQIMKLNSYLDMLGTEGMEEKVPELLAKARKASDQIGSMILFTKKYEDIGLSAPLWLDCRDLVERGANEVNLGRIRFVNRVPYGVQIFADPMFEKVVYNLVENAVKYGEKITSINISGSQVDGKFTLVCEDDGIGISLQDKEHIFEKGFGKNTGLGLALSREILDITGISIKETGSAMRGARFELTVPHEMFRVARSTY